MAHTSSTCGYRGARVLAPAVVLEEDEREGHMVPQRHAHRVRVNFHYRHDTRSWKATTKACRQFARHGR